ncbi:pilus assembly protein [Nocardioides sp. zg-1308]|uniref:pilus assembly protein TadG-related protein n=1 Tax=Nocardioides TaxID=1839 RepID=UPI0015577B62|nr:MULTISPECIES: TadE/TadG family type IV pilus assembly protein [unclassified Nocardioides]NPD05180.1 pilus assembly protein [Nocardioides sp. zg-1308]WQQ23069.1 TadE/TadG family type IV pilus assembly protein [Nocardioides sp. S-34]
MKLRRRTIRPRDERGATAVMVGLLSTVLFATAALAVDISSLAMERQRLHDHVDSAAHAGAFALPGTGTQAQTAALSMANSQDGDLNLTAGANTKLLCIVASTGVTREVKASQIPSTCNPGPPGAPFTASRYPGLRCNSYICAIPCATGTAAKCNTIEVRAEKPVDYGFAPIIGFDQGNTGSVASAACKGPCGSEVPNPLDIVIMADRTASMPSADRAQMKMAILNSLKTMTPSLHHVAFGALAKSRTSGFTPKGSFIRPTHPATPVYEDCARFTTTSTRNACRDRNTAKQTVYNAAVADWEAGESAFSKSAGWDGTGETDSDGICRSEAVRLNGRVAADTRNEGTWIPVDWTNGYLTETGALVSNSALVDAISCLPESASGEYGTNIGGSLKAAVRKVMGGSTVPGASDRPGTPRKVVIFETDGQPDEVGSATGSTAIGTTSELWSGQQSTSSSVKNGTNGCNRFKEVATNAKGAGVIVITIGFGSATTATCERYFDFAGEQKVKDVLASAASNAPSGGPSTAGDCTTPAGIAAENIDGDYFFCATKGDELAEIFKTALNQVSNSIRLIKLP